MHVIAVGIFVRDQAQAHEIKLKFIRDQMDEMTTIVRSLQREIKDVKEELLAYPNCDVCKQVRASAPVARQTNSSSGETGFVCVHCKGGHK